MITKGKTMDFTNEKTAKAFEVAVWLKSLCDDPQSENYWNPRKSVIQVRDVFAFSMTETIFRENLIKKLLAFVRRAENVSHEAIEKAFSGSVTEKNLCEILRTDEAKER